MRHATCNAARVRAEANGDFECCARHSQPILRDRRRDVAPDDGAVSSRGTPAGPGPPGLPGRKPVSAPAGRRLGTAAR